MPSDSFHIGLTLWCGIEAPISWNPKSTDATKVQAFAFEYEYKCKSDSIFVTMQMAVEYVRIQSPILRNTSAFLTTCHENGSIASPYSDYNTTVPLKICVG